MFNPAQGSRNERSEWKETHQGQKGEADKMANAAEGQQRESLTSSSRTRMAAVQRRKGKEPRGLVGVDKVRDQRISGPSDVQE